MGLHFSCDNEKRKRRIQGTLQLNNGSSPWHFHNGFFKVKKANKQWAERHFKYKFFLFSIWKHQLFSPFSDRMLLLWTSLYYIIISKQYFSSSYHTKVDETTSRLLLIVGLTYYNFVKQAIQRCRFICYIHYVWSFVLFNFYAVYCCLIFMYELK